MPQLIGNGMVEVLDKELQKVVGYAFEEDGTDSRIQKVQHWVLYSDYRPPPYSSIILRQPADPRRRYAQRSDWLAALRDGTLWEEGAKYIQVNCTSYESIIESPELPPRPDKSDQQLLDGPATVHQDGRVAGYVYTVNGGSYEHWVLFDSLVSATTSAVEVGPPATGEGAPSLSDFFDKMRRSWRAGSSYEISGCTTYSEVPTAL